MKSPIKRSLLIMVLAGMLLSACVSGAPVSVTEMAPTLVSGVQTQVGQLQTLVPTVEAVAKTQASELQTAVPSLVAPVQTAVAQLPGLKAEISIDYAQNFKLEYRDGYKLLTVTQPWTGATEAVVYYLVPEAAALPELPEGAQVFRTPVKAVISMSSTYLPFLEEIGKLESIVGIDDATYIYNEKVKSLVGEGKIATIGGGASLAPVDLEKVLQLNPDLILTSATGIPEYDTHPKMVEAGLPVVLDADYLENSPLGRAEWGKFIAAFFDLENEADALFDQVAASYLKTSAGARASAGKPSVFVNTDYQGTWYMPGGESYLAQLLQDAGTEYLFADLEGVSSHPLTFETVYEKALDADYWLNVGFASDKASLLAQDSRYADFAAVEAGRVYNFNARANDVGAVDYYESGVAHPETVLSDLVKIFHPELLPDHSLYYYQEIK